MTVRYWIGNAQYQAQIVECEVTAVATNATVSATINDKTLTYTCLAAGTVDDAAAGLVALCTASDAPTEFAELTWESSGAFITVTASTPGTPFYGMTGGLTFGAAGGATVSDSETQANLSPSDVSNALNWATGSGTTGLPVDGDSIVLQSSSVPLLWNLDYFSGVWLAAVTRWGDFVGQIGLPAQNVNGYREYRPQYFEFGDTTDACAITLGLGSGNGPELEAWNAGTQQVTLTLMSGQAVRFLGTHASNTGTVANSTLIVANAAGEAATFASLKVDGGANVTLGSGVTFSGALTVSNGQLTTFVAPASITASNNSTLTVRAMGATFAAITAKGGTRVTWMSNGTITALTLASSSIFDKSQSILPLTITDSTLDGESNCQINDPFSTITFTNATSVTGQVTTGPFTFLGPRTVKVA